MTFSPNGLMLLTAHFNGELNVYDTREFTLFRTVCASDSPIWSVAVSWESTIVALGNENGEVSLWDLRRLCGLPLVKGEEVGRKKKRDGFGKVTEVEVFDGEKRVEKEISSLFLLKRFKTKNASIKRVHFTLSNVLVVGSVYVNKNE